MTIESEIAGLTQATTNLLQAVTVSKSLLDSKVSEAAAQADLAATNGATQVALAKQQADLATINGAAQVELATTQANNAMTQAGIATVKAGEASANAASTLAIYGNTAAMQTAVAQAASQASLAAGYAASASSVVQQDLSGVNAAALHRSPNAVTALFIYDTGKDSDGGAWTKKCQHTSWYNEPINGKWLGAQASEAAARAVSGATTGDYFQRTTDGKFYSLSATSGITEAFRGNKRDFPRLAAIVAEDASVTIYDLTEPGRPMWMRFVNATGNILQAEGASITYVVTALNSVLYIGRGAAGTCFHEVSFAKDSGEAFALTTANAGAFKSNIAGRNSGAGRLSTTVTVPAGRANRIVPVVLDDSPFDSVTGLRIPVLAISYNNGVFFKKNDGTFTNNFNASFGELTALVFNKRFLIGSGWQSGSFAFAAFNSFIQNIAGLTNNTATDALDFNQGKTSYLIAQSRTEFLRTSSIPALVQKLKNSESTVARGAAATITNLFNTGHQIGDIRRTYLSDIDVGSVSNPATVSDRSYKAASATANGTLIKTAVASAAQLVAYSGFSASNYLQEPYSADLDFGTGEWSANAWVNVPVSLPGANFPLGSELITNVADREFSSITGFWGLGNNWVISAGAASHTGGGSELSASGLILTPGKRYCATYDLTLTSGIVQHNQGGPVISTSGTKTEYFTAINNTIRWYATGAASIDNFSIKELLPVRIIERSSTSGPRIEIGIDPVGKLTATAYDGTTTRTVTTTAAYNTATWLKAEANYRAGRLAILVNGVEVAVTHGTPLLTLNNANAVLTIGNSYALDSPFPGSIALLKLSATVPTPEQSAWMYEQEKQMFRDGAQCCLPDSGAIVDLAYDNATDKWIAVSATNESEWSGLVRTSVTPVPAGSYTKAAAASGVQLLARSTSSPGVDVTIPAYGLREELVKRAESAARLNAQLAVFDYVGGFTASTTSGSTSITSVAGLTYPASYIGAQITGSGIPAGTVITGVSGTTIYLSAAATATATGVQISFTDFALPVGYEAKAVLSAGALKQEGATKDYTRLFDGFKETVRFGAAPGYTAWVQVQAARNAA